MSEEDRAIQERARGFVDEDLIPWEQSRRGARRRDPRGRTREASRQGDRARPVRDEHADGARRHRHDHVPAGARLRAARPRHERPGLVRAHAAGVGARVVSEHQMETWIKPTIRGEMHECYAITEEGAGSDVDAIEATARRDGDDYVLNGVKMHVTSFNHAAYCFFQAQDRRAASTRASTRCSSSTSTRPACGSCARPPTPTRTPITIRSWRSRTSACPPPTWSATRATAWRSPTSGSGTSA